MGEKWVSLVASQYIYMYALCALQKTFRMFENMDNKQKKKKGETTKQGDGYDTVTVMIEVETAKYIQ
jgi:hypothetical protein